MERSFRIAPSILSADFLRLGEQVAAVQEAGAHQLHIDVMDGHFVDNISMGPLVARALKRIARVPLDVHLMITDPLKYLRPFIAAGASHITFHIEASSDPEECIRQLREQKVGVGLAVNPDTPAERVLDFVAQVDMILVMTVHPGFGGQSFIPQVLEKIKVLRGKEQEIRRRMNPRFALDIQVDGGIHLETAVEAAIAGANVFVAGNSIFGEPDPAAAVRAMARRLKELQSEEKP
ncbi:MAG: ribulose-phosphate 3-epimerase [Planctomycetes bacterium]|nr:ribulose-phosphate 3-epimerase [Planctomycetota bacterium]